MMYSRTTDPQPAAYDQSTFASLRAMLGSRIGLVSLAGVAIVAGLGFNWSWVVAAGVAPLLLSALPCVAMCALGLCMMQMKGRGASMGTSADLVSTTTAPPAQFVNRSDALDGQFSGDGAYKVE